MARKKRNPVDDDFMDAIRDEIESGEVVVIVPPGKTHPMDVEIAALRARVAELETDLADPFCFRPAAPAEREVIEAALVLGPINKYGELAREDWTDAERLRHFDALAALEKERRHG